MQMKNEAWGEVGNDLFIFVQSLPVSGPEGKQQPHKLEPLLESAVLALVINFTRADRHVSEMRTKIAFVFCKFIQQDLNAMICAIYDKVDDIPVLQCRTRKPQIDEDLVKLKDDIEKQWNTVGLARPATIAILQNYDQAFGTKYTDPAKNLLRRVAFQFLNADGPPSQESQQVFDDYERLLQESKDLDDVNEYSQVPVTPESKGQQSANGGKGIDKTGQTTTHQAAESTPSTEILIAELKSLIGLKDVKEDVAELTNYIRVQQLRRAKGLKSPEISLHMVFHGNPGTGKTTVARLLSKIYKALGVVSKGHLVETDRSDLVAGYVGQTALKVRSVAEKALGGILFIDEAYALKRSDDPQDFGNEAIETLLKFMEDNRQDLVVIAAGYPVEINRFLDANPGLQSRFNKSLSFPDYAPEELMEIFLRLCMESDYKLSEPAQVKLSAYFHVAYQNRDSRFGNARLVRNIFERAITNVANRVVQDPQADSSALELIEDSDVTAATAIK